VIGKLFFAARTTSGPNPTKCMILKIIGIRTGK
jgi:hypothetical protein